MQHDVEKNAEKDQGTEYFILYLSQPADSLMNRLGGSEQPRSAGVISQSRETRGRHGM
jgi:hypothetical protein